MKRFGYAIVSIFLAVVVLLTSGGISIVRCCQTHCFCLQNSGTQEVDLLSDRYSSESRNDCCKTGGIADKHATKGHSPFCKHVKVEKLKNENISSMMTLSEESRRMQDMMKMYGMDANMFGGANGATLVLNANHPLVKYVAEHKEDETNVPLICQQLYDLAMMAHKQLSPEEMTQFIARSNQILLALAK